jgi:hypothetical protein
MFGVSRVYWVFGAWRDGPGPIPGTTWPRDAPGNRPKNAPGKHGALVVISAPDHTSISGDPGRIKGPADVAQ